VRRSEIATHVTRHNTPIHNILSTAPQLIICQKALGKLPEEGNVMPKHVGATIHNKLVTVHSGSNPEQITSRTDRFIRAYLSCLCRAVLAVLLCPYFVVTSGHSSLREGAKCIMSACLLADPVREGRLLGAVDNKKGEGLLCFFRRDSSVISGSQSIGLSLNVLESGQLSINGVSDEAVAARQLAYMYNYVHHPPPHPRYSL
jgi:hypothetical protein